MKYNFFDLLSEKSPFYLMEAHNSISAKIVERTGFNAIWASGFSIATSFGLRDNNELSWKTLIDTLNYMQLYDGHS